MESKEKSKEISWEQFDRQITAMNQMYELPCESYFRFPSKDITFIRRVIDFKYILLEEVNELNEIIQNSNADLDGFVELADLLGDIIVYCMSEAKRYGLPMSEILNIIMESNMSKLGEDGKPIKDERDKFLKGPNYWKPEPLIRELLGAKLTRRDSDIFHDAEGRN